MQLHDSTLTDHDLLQLCKFFVSMKVCVEFHKFSYLFCIVETTNFQLLKAIEPLLSANITLTHNKMCNALKLRTIVFQMTDITNF